MLNSPLYYIGTAISFYKKQPLLNSVVCWLLIVPYVLISAVEMGMQTYGSTAQSTLGMSSTQLNVVYVVLQILLSLWVLLGILAVLTIGMRLVKSPAGRTKSSLQSVVTEAKVKVLPVFFTGIIRDCFTLLLTVPYFIAVTLFLLSRPPEELNNFIAVLKSSILLQSTTAEFNGTISSVIVLLLPLLLPAMYYRITTSFYQQIMVAEKKQYRSALSQSRAYVRGRFVRITITLLLTSILTFIPISILLSALEFFIDSFDKRLLILMPPLNGIGMAFATALFSLAIMTLYKDVHVNTTPAAVKLRKQLPNYL